MATVSTPEQAVQQLSHLMKESGNPHDAGFLVNMGAAILGSITRLKNMVALSGGLAQKGTVTVTISLHAFRDEAKEIRCKPSVKIGRKLPEEFLPHKGEFWVGDEGELSTSPIARGQDKLWTPDVLDGGQAIKAKEERKGSKAI